MCLEERKEKTNSEERRFSTYFIRKMVFSVWVTIWGIKDFRDLYQITENGANVEIVLILYSLM